LTDVEPRPGASWERLKLAFLGGDERDPEIARLAAATGAEVRAFGLPWPEDGIPGVSVADSPEGAVTGADYLLLPIPLGVGLEVYAPHAERPITADAGLLGALAPGAHVFLGRATPQLREVAEKAGVHVHDYDPDRELMLLRAPAIVEGAIQLAIENTEITINDASVVVVGFGNIGALLARRLLGLGARVHVAARNPTQRAGAYADGAIPLSLEELPSLAPELQMVFSTVPAQVVGRELLERLQPGTLVLDIAPPPDHADLELAAELGHRAVWARGLGRRAPVTVGKSQWIGLRRYIEEIERERPDRRTPRASAAGVRR
jgi:dipicolinate synthase subunit A